PVPSGRPTRRPAGPVRPSIPTASRPPDRAAERPPDSPTGLDRPEAERLITDASKRIWRPEGADALAYLHGRCLTDATIRAARLGYTPRVMIPIQDGARRWRVAGITIPWEEQGILRRVKIRRIGLFRGTRYIEVFSDSPSLFPGPEAIRPGE